MKQIGQHVKSAFAKGLTATFSGKSTFEKILRGKFPIVSSSLNDSDITYIDQWLPDRTGGGQEILETGGKRYTRVYTGGTIDEISLSRLGITKAEVMVYLKKVLLRAATKTRFDQPYREDDAPWTYEYIPDVQEETIGMITGKEIISYSHTPVFVHFFIISPVLG